MLALKLDTGQLDQKFKMLLDMPRTIEKAVVGAMADTVNDVHRAQIQEMSMSFNKVSPYVKKGLIKMLPYGKDRQVGSRRFGQTLANSGTAWEEFPARGSPNAIVRPNVFGGTRGKKASENRLKMQGILPAGGFTIQGNDYPKGASGNINGARYSEMLAAIGALSETARSQMPKGKQRNRKNVSFFVLRRGGTPIGIAERRGNDVKVMLAFARNVNYKKIYPFHKVGREQLNYSLPRHFDRILKRYLDRL